MRSLCPCLGLLAGTLLIYLCPSVSCSERSVLLTCAAACHCVCVNVCAPTRPESRAAGGFSCSPCAQHGSRRILRADQTLGAEAQGVLLHPAQRLTPGRAEDSFLQGPLRPLPAPHHSLYRRHQPLQSLNGTLGLGKQSLLPLRAAGSESRPETLEKEVLSSR